MIEVRPRQVKNLVQRHIVTDRFKTNSTCSYGSLCHTVPFGVSSNWSEYTLAYQLEKQK